MAEPKIKFTSKIVLDQLKRFPNTPSLTLAKKIFEENKLVFNSIDHVRSIIKLYRGQSGAKNRNETKDKRFFKEAGKYNPFNLPPSDESIYEPYILPVASNNILLLSDIHIPYHNIPALTATLQYGKEQKINTIFLNGDIIDCYEESDFEKDPRKRGIKEELEMMREFLDILKKNFPRAKIYYKIGNHEERHERVLLKKAPMFLDMEEFRLDVLLRLRERGIEFIKGKTIVKAGKLSILHGHELPRGIAAPVNVARGFYMRAKENMIGGHHHQTSEHTEPSLNGSVITTWSTGCLCELHPEYMRINKWNHGFAHVKVSRNWEFSVKNIRIINGKIV